MKNNYCCYQITNKINGKFYRGKSTVARIKAGYFGSGLRLWEAIEKYGKGNFSLEILKTFETEEEAFEYEKAIVVLDLQKSYNIKPGGRGGSHNLIWVNKNGKQTRIDPSLLEGFLEEGYVRGQCPGHLDNFRAASITEKVNIRRQQSRKSSGATKQWSELMRTPEIREKAAKHSLETRTKLGITGKCQQWLHSPEADSKHQQTINRKKTVVRTEEFKAWYSTRTEEYHKRPHSAVRDYLESIGKNLEDFNEYEETVVCSQLSY